MPGKRKSSNQPPNSDDSTIRPVDELTILRDAEEQGNEYLLRILGWTEQQYLNDSPEDRRCDFWEGEIVIQSPVAPWHQEVTWRLITILGAHLERAAPHLVVLNGPAAIRLGPQRWVEPDVFCVPRDAVGENWVIGQALLVIEILSRSTRTYDLVEKAVRYREAGVGEYWMVDRANRRVVVERAGSPAKREEISTGRLECATVPAFWIDVDWIWQEPLPRLTDLLAQYL